MCKIFEDLRKEALEEGKEIGLTEGKKIGLLEGKIENAKNMLIDGSITIENIAKFVGLPLEEVKKLKATL